MEELSWSVKIVGLLACIGVIFLVAAHDLIFRKFKRSPKAGKNKE
ncbi:MAG: hypothetical protein ACPL5I_12695 [Thermodesulfobacteriota bacterium]